jgi:hypothetical protein
MRFGPVSSAEAYAQALHLEVAATFGEVRAEADQGQIEAAARALHLVAQLELPWTAEDPFFLGIGRDG